jgi:hypothetical protein
MPPLHVFTGDHAAATVRAALKVPVGETLVQHDVISCGPVIAFESRDEWIRRRDDFWNEVCGGPALEEFPEDLVIDAEKLARSDRVTLWVGAGLSDRLLLPTVLKLADLVKLTLPPLEIVEITTHRSLSVPVLGWGALRADDVGRPAAKPVTSDHRALAQRAWAGLTGRSPTSLLHALEALDDDAALQAAMCSLIGRYPDATMGLSHWDAALLSAIGRDGADASTVIGGAIGANHYWLDPVGDVYLFWRLRRLASPDLRQPLVTLSGDTNVMRHCRVTPTPFGLDVRDGRANHVTVNGIDDWVGGVHLRQPTGSPWYRRGDQLLSQSSL